jgi:hypothetical protein
MNLYGRSSRTLWLVAAGVIIVYALAFWPGTINLDGKDMLQQGVTSTYTDWHSPLLSWLWGRLNVLIAGPGGLFVMIVVGFVAGHAVIASCFLREGMPGRAWLCMLTLFFPLTAYALLEVGKDSFLAAALILLIGVVLLYSQRPRHSTLFLLFLIGILLLAADARKNAFVALLPLLVYAVSGNQPWRRPTLRSMAIAVAALLLVQAGTWLIDKKLLRAADTHELVSLEIFDLAGESYFAGVDVSHGLLGEDFMTQVQACYNDRQWDEFMWRACHTTGQNAMARLSAPDGDVYARELLTAWFGGIAEHPLAYLDHRMAYWLTLIRWQCDACDEELNSFRWRSENPPEHAYTPTFVARAMDSLATPIVLSPFARPYVLLLELLVCSGICAVMTYRRQPTLFASMGLCLSLSGLFYASGYLLFGVASPLRYLLWTYVCGLLAPIFASAALARGHARIEVAGTAIPRSAAPKSALRVTADTGGR